MRGAQNDEQIKALEAVATWFEIVLKEKPDYKFTNVRNDLWHSALLGRLLRGIKPLPEPPPRRYSYPWYGLVERGSAETDDVWLTDIIAGVRLEKPWLTICQAGWDIIERRGVDDYLVCWKGQEQVYRCWRLDETIWRIEKMTDEQLVELGYENN